VPSASPQPIRLAVLVICGLLLCGAAAGCSTTQEKAEIQQARSKHILEARAERQRKKHADGAKPAHRSQEGKQ
jgi:hypothetical protein